MTILGIILKFEFFHKTKKVQKVIQIMVVFTKANGGSIVLSNEILAAAAAESLDDDVELNLHGLLEALELDVQNRCYQL